MTDTFIPTIYVLNGCPFCMKLGFFLAGTGPIAAVRIVEVEGGAGKERIGALLTEKLGQATYLRGDRARRVPSVIGGG